MRGRHADVRSVPPKVAKRHASAADAAAAAPGAAAAAGIAVNKGSVILVRVYRLQDIPHDDVPPERM